MRLTQYTDYALRTLILLGLKGEALATIAEIAGRYGISENHLMKLVHALGRMGYVETMRGRNGGLRLARLPTEIRLGEVVRRTESDFALVECFDAERNGCPITGSCVLERVLAEALQSFMRVLDAYTLADLLVPAAPLRRALGLPD
jgi:Rrf2 family transcriptional regulator, nitric oxide-sensitive transcriptional repressor